MADKHDHLHENGYGEVSDETIRRFLLGRLSESEQSAFEQRLFSEDALDARVRLAELDLADDYAYGRLGNDARALFEEKFLVSADRRQKVEVSSILRERFGSAPVLSSTFVERLRALPALTRPAWRYAFAVAILLMLIGTTWLVIKEPRFVQRIANDIAHRNFPSRSAPREMDHPTNTSSPEHQTAPSPMPVHDQPTVSSVRIALVPAASPDDNVPSFALPEGEGAVVQMQLAVNPVPAVTYRAELLTIEGQSLFSAESMVADNDRGQINFYVPAHLLKAGNYQIRLNRGNAAGWKENVGSFYFRVQ